MRLKSDEGQMLNAKGLKIGIVTSTFNQEITQALRNGAISFLVNAGMDEADITSVEVPGAFEIPLAIKALIRSKSIHGVVALGAVIRGDTPHFEYVCHAVERGCSELSLEFQKPVGFGVLTVDTEAQARERIGGPKGNKGEEAAAAVVQMCHLLQDLQNS